MGRLKLSLAGLVVAGAACHLSGGGLSAEVIDIANAPVANARLVITFPSLVGEPLTHAANGGESGSFRIMWDHGSWRDSTIEVSASGFRPVRATFGNGYWDCKFQLAPDTGTTQSFASCRQTP